MAPSELAATEPRPSSGQRRSRLLLKLAVIVVAAAGGHAHAQLATPLNPNQQSMSLAIRDTSVVPFEGVCPRLGRKLTDEGSLPEVENNLLVRCKNVVNEIDRGLQANALQELTAEELNAPAANAIDFSRSQRSNVAARLVALRAGGTSLASLEWNSLIPATTGGAAGDEAMGGRLGLFVNGTLGEGDKDETEFEAAYDFELLGFTAGVDYRFTDTLVGGIALGYSESDTDFDDDGGSLDADGLTGSLFGSWYGERAYADLIVSYGSQSYDSVRNVQYTLTAEPLAIDHTATGDTDGEVTAAGLSAGYAFGSGGWRIGPIAAVSYLRVDIDGFAEQGGSNPELNLEFEDQDAKSLQLQLGLDLAYAASLSWGVLTPYARASQVWEQENDQQTFLIRYVADPFKTSDTTAAVTSDDVDDAFVLWAVGLSATFANGFAAFLDYEAVSGLDTVSYGEFTLGLRYQFR